MNLINFYKAIAYSEEFSEVTLGYPSSLFWEKDIYEEDIFDSWKDLVKDIKGKKIDHGVGLYLNYPFCSKICKFCQIDTIKYEQEHDEYLSLIDRESLKYAEIFRGIRIQNFYIGGGTISLLSPTQIEELFSILKKHFDFSDIQQITAELNPASTSIDKLKVFHKHGMNRLVFGIQSTDTQLMIENDRPQKIEHAIKLITDAKEVGILDIKIDIIAGLPGDTLEGFKNTLDMVERYFKVTEVTIYPFSPHINTGFIKSGGVYTEEDILLRSKMIQLGKEFYKKNKFYDSYNHQIVSEEKGKLSILALGVFGISKVFGRGIFRCDDYKEYKKWLIEGQNIKFKGILHGIENEMRWYTITNLTKLYADDFFSIFQKPIEETFIYEILKKLIDMGIIVSGKDDKKGIFFKFKFDNRLFRSVNEKFFYSPELNKKALFRLSKRKGAFDDIDFKLKQIFGLN